MQVLLWRYTKIYLIWLHRMDLLTILGLAAATITTVSFLPQMFKTWQTKSAKDVSLVTLITFMSGIFLWLIYGIYLQSLPIILANSVTLVFNFIILWLKIKYR
jgi:MtN3 and saliva related transmembrane protein